VSDEDSRNYSGGSQLHTPRIYLENEGEMGGGREIFIASLGASKNNWAILVTKDN